MIKKSPSRVDFRLYLITDRRLFPDGRSFFSGIEQALKGGVKAVQLREKDLEIRELLEMAGQMREMSGRYGAKLFINDRVDVAMAVGADGVHLGVSGIPAHAARKAAGEYFLIGASAHSAEETRKAEQEGADFVTLGPVYETPSKMGYGKPLGTGIFKKATDEVSIPIFAIGGIKKERIDEVGRAGAYGVALISGILASDGIKTMTEEFMRLLK